MYNIEVTENELLILKLLVETAANVAANELKRNPTESSAAAYMCARKIKLSVEMAKRIK